MGVQAKRLGNTCAGLVVSPDEMIAVQGNETRSESRRKRAPGGRVM